MEIRNHLKTLATGLHLQQATTASVSQEQLSSNVFDMAIGGFQRM